MIRRSFSKLNALKFTLNALQQHEHPHQPSVGSFDEMGDNPSSFTPSSPLVATSKTAAEVFATLHTRPTASRKAPSASPPLVAPPSPQPIVEPRLRRKLAALSNTIPHDGLIGGDQQRSGEKEGATKAKHSPSKPTESYTPLTISGNVFDTAAETMLRNAARAQKFKSPYWVGVKDLNLLGIGFQRNAFRIAVPAKGTSGRTIVVINAECTDDPSIFASDVCNRYNLPLDINGDTFNAKVTKVLMASAQANKLTSPYWMTEKQLRHIGKTFIDAAVDASGESPSTSSSPTTIGLREGAKGTLVGLETLYNAQETTHPAAFTSITCTNVRPRSLYGDTFSSVPMSFLQSMTAAMKRHQYKSSIWVSHQELQKLGGSVKPGAMGLAYVPPVPPPSPSGQDDATQVDEGPTSTDAATTTATAPTPTIYYNADQTTISTHIEDVVAQFWSNAKEMLAKGFVPCDGLGRRFGRAVDQSMLCAFAAQRGFEEPVFVTEHVIKLCGAEVSAGETGIALPGREGHPVFNIAQSTDPDRVRFCASYRPTHVGTRQMILPAHRYALARLAFDNGFKSTLWIPLHLAAEAGLQQRMLVASAAAASGSSSSEEPGESGGTMAYYRLPSNILPSEEQVPGSGILINAEQTTNPKLVEFMENYSPRAPSGFLFGNRLLHTNLMRAVAAREGYHANMWATNDTIERSGTVLKNRATAPLVKNIKGFAFFNLEETQEPQKLRTFAAELQTKPLAERFAAEGFDTQRMKPLSKFFDVEGFTEGFSKRSEAVGGCNFVFDPSTLVTDDDSEGERSSLHEDDHVVSFGDIPDTFSRDNQTHEASNNPSQ